MQGHPSDVYIDAFQVVLKDGNGLDSVVHG